MPDLPASAPDRNCEICRGQGYTVGRDGESALAAPCTCLPPCQRCQGTGRVSIQWEGSMQVGRCVCRRLLDRIALFNKAGIPGRFADATLESFAQGAMKAKDNKKFAALTGVSAWQGRFDPTIENRGLVLHGKVGRGKTHLLIGILRTLIFEHGVRVRFVEFTRLLGMLREAYGAGKSDAPLLNELAAVDVLAIDELGKGRMSDWELSIIDEVVSRRYNAMGCTLATSNFRPEAYTGALPPNLSTAAHHSQTLGDRVGERIYSRLVEMVDFVEVAGKDFREQRRSR